MFLLCVAASERFVSNQCFQPVKPSWDHSQEHCKSDHSVSALIGITAQLCTGNSMMALKNVELFPFLFQCSGHQRWKVINVMNMIYRNRIHWHSSVSEHVNSVRTLYLTALQPWVVISESSSDWFQRGKVLSVWWGCNLLINPSLLPEKGPNTSPFLIKIHWEDHAGWRTGHVAPSRTSPSSPSPRHEIFPVQRDVIQKVILKFISWLHMAYSILSPLTSAWDIYYLTEINVCRSRAKQEPHNKDPAPFDCILLNFTCDSLHYVA